jgi:hypothetical protein
MRPSFPLLLVVVFSACDADPRDSSRDTSPPGDADVDADTDSDTDDCVFQRFAASPSDWSLPGGFPDEEFRTLAPTTAELSWTLMDLEGDGASDLVVTRRDELGLSELGTTKWLLYTNQGDGFSLSPSDWALPAGFPDEEFLGLSPTSAELSWTLMDLEGDGAPDLVVIRRDELGLPELGTSKWLLYTNQGDGFAQSPSDWALPAGFPDEEFQALYPSGSELSWSLMDLDGDGAVDLVVTRRDELGVPELGTTKWLLYSNQGDGFASSPSDWTLPAGFPDEEFQALYPGSPELAWSLMDLDGDGAVDLVVTQREELGVPELGTSKWLLYSNQGDGFASSPSDWSLPAGFDEGDFEAIVSPVSDMVFSIFDLDGGATDLVLSRRDELSVEQLGSSKWLLYTNEGDGFASAPADWLLPEGFASGTFETFSSADDELVWQLMDLTSDGGTDLLVSHRAEIGVDELGTSKWLVYPSLCE